MLDLVDKLILMDRGQIIAYGPRDDIIRRLQARNLPCEDRLPAKQPVKKAYEEGI
jgi:ABC-type multidrug transport system ATPase subunit